MAVVTAGRDASAGRVPLAARDPRRAAYWLTTLGVLAVALVWPAFLPEVRPGWRHLALSLAFVPHLDPRGLPFPTLPPGWTLDYEALFYLIFAAALAGPRAWRGRLVVGALSAVTAFGFLVPEPFYYLGANPMLLQFAAGVGLGLAVEHGIAPSRRAGAALILAALAWWTAVQAGGLFTELWRPLLWGVPAFMTVAGALGVELNGRIGTGALLPLRGRGTATRWRGRTSEASPYEPPSRPSAVLPPGGGEGTRLARLALILGDGSYAIYILHLPATALIAHTLGYARPWLFLPAAVAGSLAAGLAGRALVEKPLLEYLRGAPGRRGQAITAT